MNVLVLIAHPQLNHSRVNRRWKQELESVPDVTIHDLYAQYPDEHIDVKSEQSLLHSHDRIVFQFPFYWYSTPPLLKKWMEEVFTYGWAYGPGEKALQGKELILAISIGGPEHSYRVGGYNHYTISELTRPLQATANLTGMYFLPHFVQYGVVSAEDEVISRSASAYVQHITAPQSRRYRMAP
ncbi:NAD(P)H-dependent oxidoreductase [Paenibacillus chitinolyticus]|uniref:NAD(P)H-dependent oxidoreductase n=1 Tax=Paenibacillus chitinolyticus TaxID=79263 RepID=UPI002DB68766|nr:NAD(P)H-dependent oxidoreductase [Paenibacillus chitinolyticus]MEC0246346.1 NAD(P)H-dependent oxidoreductase [Paenibacillus chitinolyticus]